MALLGDYGWNRPAIRETYSNKAFREEINEFLNGRIGRKAGRVSAKPKREPRR